MWLWFAGCAAPHSDCRTEQAYPWPLAVLCLVLSKQNSQKKSRVGQGTTNGSSLNHSLPRLPYQQSWELPGAHASGDVSSRRWVEALQNYVPCAKPEPSALACGERSAFAGVLPNKTAMPCLWIAECFLRPPRGSIQSKDSLPDPRSVSDAMDAIWADVFEGLCYQNKLHRGFWDLSPNLNLKLCSFGYMCLFDLQGFTKNEVLLGASTVV